MLSNYLSAGLRNFSRNRAYSIIVTLSLALGFAAMMLASIYWRYEHTYDRFWPNADRTYLLTVKYEGLPGRPGPQTWGSAPSSIDSTVAQTVSGVEEVTRLTSTLMQVTTKTTDVRDRPAWVSRNFFHFFPVKLIAGNLDDGLRPGFATLTKAGAVKYFGRFDVVGETMTLTTPENASSPVSVRVGALVDDWPKNSHLNADMLLAGETPPKSSMGAALYVKVRKGVSEEGLQRSLETASRHLPALVEHRAESTLPTLKPIPLRHAYAPPKAYGQLNHGGRMPPNGLPEVFMGLGALMLIVSAINFINLMTARGAGRAVEVGVRKVAGARRRDLVVQFVGEGLLYTGFAFLLALALVEITRPVIQTLTGQALPFDYGKSLGVLGVFALGAVVAGILSSLYPAIVLSAIRPIRAIRNDFAAMAGSRRLRQTLVVLQFIPLLLLAGGGFVFQGNERIAFKNSLKLIPENAVVIRERCDAALKPQLRAISGVASVACLEMDGWHGTGGFTGEFQPIGDSTGWTILDTRGDYISKAMGGAGGGAWQTDREALEFYDTKVLAGSLWANTADDRGLVLNEYAAQLLGYDAASAVGKEVTLGKGRPPRQQVRVHPVIAVVANRGGVPKLAAQGYLQVAPAAERTNLVAGVRLTRDADPAAVMAAIDKAFVASIGRNPRRAFYRDEYFAHKAQERQIVGWLAACVGVGLLMSAAGLFAMAVFLANLRTREIGIRKTFGASRATLLRILIFQFAKPVLIANFIAMPVVIWFASGLADDLPVDQRSALTVSAIATVVLGSLVITFIATSSQAWRVTGQLPLKALRSE